jgi:hypothetical protein
VGPGGAVPGAAAVEVDPTPLTTADGYRPETRSELVGVRFVRTGR